MLWLCLQLPAKEVAVAVGEFAEQTNEHLSSSSMTKILPARLLCNSAYEKGVNSNEFTPFYMGEAESKNPYLHAPKLLLFLSCNRIVFSVSWYEERKWKG